MSITCSGIVIINFEQISRILFVVSINNFEKVNAGPKIAEKIVEISFRTKYLCSSNRLKPFFTEFVFRSFFSESFWEKNSVESTFINIAKPRALYKKDS